MERKTPLGRWMILRRSDKGSFRDHKGTVARKFLSKVVSPKVPNWSPDSWSKAVLNIDSNSARNSTSKVLLRYGPLQQVLLCTMGHYGKFVCALWVTAANLVIRYGPLQWIWLYAMGHCTEWDHTVKIYDDFCTMGHMAGFGSAEGVCTILLWLYTSTERVKNSTSAQVTFEICYLR